MIKINGNMGEGGGQVLRTSLSLGAITKQAFVIDNIRAGRKKPGLLRQHYTCVQAAQQICNAKITGAELGSTKLEFIPGLIKAGQFEFAIGTAGSTILLAQTILPILAAANAPSQLSFKGGTHNDMAPSLCFFQRSFIPLMAKMGLKLATQTESLGFNPAGGGHWHMQITPCPQLQPLTLEQPAADFAKQPDNCKVTALLSALPDDIGWREVKTVLNELGWQENQGKIHSVKTPGPGNSLQLSIKSDSHHHQIEVYGQRGVRAEVIAKRALKQFHQLIDSHGAVEQHLADQLLLPMALAGKGRFTTSKPSSHTLTNIEVIQQFLPVKIELKPLTEQLWQVEINGKTK